MPILNCFPNQKTVEYNTILENEIYFSDSISGVKQKIGKPVSTEKCGNQTTLEYKRKVHALISTAYYCFDDGKLCSVCYESDALTNNELQLFLSELENIIIGNAFDGVIRYASFGKEYWELSDGAVSMHICLYAEKNIVHIKIDYFD
ncbi:MAG: hypothetical protein ACLUFN_11185 [Eubacterium sp.]